MPLASRSLKSSFPFVTSAATIIDLPSIVTREPVTLIVSLGWMRGLCLSMYQSGPSCTATVSFPVCSSTINPVASSVCRCGFFNGQNSASDCSNRFYIVIVLSQSVLDSR